MPIEEPLLEYTVLLGDTRVDIVLPAETRLLVEDIRRIEDVGLNGVLLLLEALFGRLVVWEGSIFEILEGCELEGPIVLGGTLIEESVLLPEAILE